MNNKPVVEFTFKEIYEQMKHRQELDDIRHHEIISRLDKTNGKVRLNRWIASTALGLIISFVLIAI